VSLRPAEPRVLPTGRRFRPKQLASNPSAGLKRLARPEPVAGLLSVGCSARADRPRATGQPAAPEAGRFALRKTAARVADLTRSAAPACAHSARLPDRYHAKRTARWREHAQAAEVRRWRSAEGQHERAVAARDRQSVEACRKPVVVEARHSWAVEEVQHRQAADLRRSLGTPEPAGRYNRLPALPGPRPVETPSSSSARKVVPRSPGRPHSRKVGKQGWRPR
jgi:hypothetical protein